MAVPMLLRTRNQLVILELRSCCALGLHLHSALRLTTTCYARRRRRLFIAFVECSSLSAELPLC